MSDYLYIRNWARWQHYSDRNPPWIKLHAELLSSEDWVTLDDASRVLAIACMLIASKNGGRIPNNPEYLQRVAYLHSTPNLKPLISCGFLVDDASKMLARASNCKRALANARPETETETETEGDPDQIQIRSRSEEDPPIAPQGGCTRKPKPEAPQYSEPFGAFWEAYPRKVGKGAAWAAWVKRRPPAGDVMRAIEQQRASPQWIRDGGQFIPNPATWLNQRRWEDETEGDQTNAGTMEIGF